MKQHIYYISKDVHVLRRFFYWKDLRGKYSSDSLSVQSTMTQRDSLSTYCSFSASN